MSTLDRSRQHRFFNLDYIRRMPRMIYEAFVHDTVRIYRVLPKTLRFRLYGIVSIQFIFAVLETSTILVISFFGMSLVAPEAARANPVVRLIFLAVPSLENIVADPRSFVSFSCILVIIFIASKNLVAYLAFRKTSRFAESMSLHISQETLWRYLHKNYFWHISPDSGSIIQRMNYRQDMTSMLVSLLLLYSNALCCVLLFSSLLIAEPKLTLVVMAIFTVVCSSVYLGLRRRIDRAAGDVYQAGNKLSKGLIGITRGIREVLIYRQQKVFFNTLSEALKEGAPGRIFLNFSNHAPAWFLEVAGFSTICGVTIYMVVHGAPMGDIVKAATMLMLTAWRILPAVNRVLFYAVAIRGVKPQAMSCIELLETFIQENPEPIPEPDPDFKFERELSLEKVDFQYPQSQEMTLADLSLDIGKGQSVGLIGVSGAGKSTLALLLSGLVEPRSGRILVDGRPLNPAERAAYVQKVGFVPQSPLLMPGTVADNVAFSQWGREYDLERVEAACRKAAMDFIDHSPQGIKTPISDGGGGLSGGQAQRVSIARALFTDPDLIIFDEATSSLDQASENLIKHTIENLRGQITTVIIAHRLSTVESCDRLFWLEGGRLKDAGPPEEILPKYRAAMSTAIEGN